MRQLLFVLIVMAAGTFSAIAQERTLLDGSLETSGFIAPASKYTTIDDHDALLVGVRGGWIINDSLVIGGGGYGLSTRVEAPRTHGRREDLDVAFGYGGFELEYIVKPAAVAHLSLSTLVGGGATQFVRDTGSVRNRRSRVGDPDYLFVVEPMVSAEVNITRSLHLNAGVSYRQVSGVRQDGLDDNDFSGVAAVIAVKFIRH